MGNAIEEDKESTGKGDQEGGAKQGRQKRTRECNGGMTWRNDHDLEEYMLGFRVT